MRVAKFENWSGGVQTAPNEDMISAEAFPGARNSQLVSIGRGLTVPAKRKGLTMLNTTTEGAVVLGLFEYKRYAAGSYTTYWLAVTSAGKLRKLDRSVFTFSDASATATPFTTGNRYPDYAAANNLAFFVNGTENKKFDGTNVQNMGITRPAAAPTVADAAVAGNPNGTYEFAITYYNSATGQESSLSASNSVSVTSSRINVSWSAPADTQIDYVRVYVRKSTLNAKFFRLTTGSSPSPNTTYGGFAVATTSTEVNITDAQISALTQLAPTTSSNDPPPVLSLVEYHQGRLFGVAASDPSTLLFSGLVNDPREGVEAWNPSFALPVAAKDGDSIKCVHSANEILYIFKSRSIWILVGEYPNWELRLLSDAFGATSHRGVLSWGNSVYFWSQFGGAVIDPSGSPQLLLQSSNSTLIDQDALAFGELDKVTVGLDAKNMRVMWALPEIGKTRNTFLLPWSIRLGCLESSSWTLHDIATMGNVTDTAGNNIVLMGDYGGRVFRFGDANNDGIPSGTTSGMPTAATSTTLTDSGAAFYTTGSGLAQLYVYVRDAAGQHLQRKRIASNTGTVLTLDSGETFDPVPNITYTYCIGGPDFELDTRFEDFGEAFRKKRFEHLTTMYIAPTQTTVQLDIYTNFSTSLDEVRTITLTTDTIGAQWDVDAWDVGVFGTDTFVGISRKRVGKVGRNIKIRIRNWFPDIPLIIPKLAVTAELQSMKR